MKLNECVSSRELLVSVEHLLTITKLPCSVVKNEKIIVKE